MAVSKSGGQIGNDAPIWAASPGGSTSWRTLAMRRSGIGHGAGFFQPCCSWQNYIGVREVSVG